MVALVRTFSKTRARLGSPNGWTYHIGANPLRVPTYLINGSPGVLLAWPLLSTAASPAVLPAFPPFSLGSARFLLLTHSLPMTALGMGWCRRELALDQESAASPGFGRAFFVPATTLPPERYLLVPEISR
jgi:hypothetical protein